MDGYVIIFSDGTEENTYPLPVSPEEIEVSSVQAVERYEILKLGQIAVPAHMELKEYSFEAELPVSRNGIIPSYVRNPEEFQKPQFLIDQLQKWRSTLKPIRFIAGRYLNSQDILEDDSFNTLVLIEDLTITERAGEEGDKYVGFKLLEYREHAAQPADEIIYILSTGKKAKVKKKKGVITPAVSPKSTGYYVVKQGDSLWSIAKKQYGDGSKCNIIYNANKDKIKSPALINVGWKLKIPEVNEFTKYSAALPATKEKTKTTVSKTSADQTSYEQSLLETNKILKEKTLRDEKLKNKAIWA